ncbi:hypothetical protein C4K09_0951 [Pseudomonas chlororaphis subsp. aureofaciens]|nr:hypothetical protein C4K09_0951 [Pseudomonas chlororaphis subsp. aureofaciens]
MHLAIGGQGSSFAPRASTLPRRLLPSPSNSSRRSRRATRAGRPSSKKAFNWPPRVASTAALAGPSNSPASSAASRSKMCSPMATPLRGAAPLWLNTPSGRFCNGKSAWSLAEATQLRVMVG